MEQQKLNTIEDVINNITSKKISFEKEKFEAIKEKEKKFEEILDFFKEIIDDVKSKFDNNDIEYIYDQIDYSCITFTYYFEGENLSKLHDIYKFIRDSFIMIHNDNPMFERKISRMIDKEQVMPLTMYVKWDYTLIDYIKSIIESDYFFKNNGLKFEYHFSYKTDDDDNKKNLLEFDDNSIINDRDRLVFKKCI